MNARFTVNKNSYKTRPDQARDLEVFVDADFAGNWDPGESLDQDTARSRHRYIIMYKGCPITWKSQLRRDNSPELKANTQDRCML